MRCDCRSSGVAGSSSISSEATQRDMLKVVSGSDVSAVSQEGVPVSLGDGLRGVHRGVLHPLLLCNQLQVLQGIWQEGGHGVLNAAANLQQ